MGKASKNTNDWLIRDPLSQLGVTEDVPPGISPTDLLPEGYLSDDIVRCSFCPQRQAHKKGYFAVLPDGGIALCGHCCATKIAGKETVAAIDRRRDTAASGLKRKEAADRLTNGLAQLMEALEDGPLQAEAGIRNGLALLRDVFGHHQAPPDPFLAIGCGGIKSIMKSAESGSFSEKDVPHLMQKRSQAITLVKKGVDQLPDARRLISYNAVGEVLESAHRRHGWGFEWDGRLIKLKKTNWDGGTQQFIVENCSTDLRRVRGLLAGM